MSTNELADFLRSTELLSEIPGEALVVIASQMQSLEVPAGTVLFEEGEPGDTAYLILDGEMMLTFEGIELLRRGPGGFVGEFSLIDDRPRSTSGIARTHLSLLAWGRRAFHETLATDPEVARAILRTLTAKLRTDVERGVGLITERDRWHEDLARSREIQVGMLPPEVLQVADLEVAGRCVPAGAVGGDFYDVLPLADGRTALIMADVTGHGFHSGLIVAMAKSCLHTQARFDGSPAGMMQALRHTLSLSLERGMLMTCTYLVFDADGRGLAYANAGHPHPLHWSAAAARVTPHDVLDPILGAQDVDETRYQERRVPWCPDDRVVLYSDGVTEARSPTGEEFGRRRLAVALANSRSADAETTRDCLLGAVTAHRAGTPVGDDLTLVVARARRSG